MDNDLLGMWFISKEDKKDRWQGQFTKQISPHLYLALLRSWESGDPTCYKLIDISDVAFQEWDLYKTHEDFMAR
jgi:hypothetical protein